MGRLFLVVWLLMSIAALAGMYHLWWTRERVLYCGKDTDEQRKAVFVRAGLPPNIVPAVKEIDRSWPRYGRYQAMGSANILSYVKYILIPRVPSDKGDLKLFVENNNMRVEDTQVRTGAGISSEFREDQPSPHGFLLSLLLITGMALLIRKVVGRDYFWPELYVLAVLILTLLLILSKVFTGEARFGMWLAAFSGLAGLFFSVKYLVAEIRRSSGSGHLSGGCRIKARPHPACAAVAATAGRRPAPRSFLHLWNGNRISEWRKLCDFRWFLVAGIVLAFVWSFLMAVVVVPDDWDCWATWAPKAKLMALGRGPLGDVTRVGGHADYPVLWPAVWSFSGRCAGGWEEQWSKGWGPVFMLLTAWEIMRIIQNQTRQSGIGIFGAALFISVPMVPLVASWGYAEAPFWLMTTCSFATLLQWRTSGLRRDLILAGLFATAAAHTKNEGLVFCVLGAIWVGLNNRRRFVFNFLIFLLPFLVLFLPWFWWVRVSLGLGSVSTQQIRMDIDQISMAICRAPCAIYHIGQMWADIRQWNIVWAAIVLSSVYAIFRGSRSTRIDVFLPVGMLSVSFIIMLFFPAEIGWTIKTSWNRITLQTLPLFVLAVIPGICRIMVGQQCSHDAFLLLW